MLKDRYNKGLIPLSNGLDLLREKFGTVIIDQVISFLADKGLVIHQKSGEYFVHSRMVDNAEDLRIQKLVDSSLAGNIEAVADAEGTQEPVFIFSLDEIAQLYASKEPSLADVMPASIPPLNVDFKIETKQAVPNLKVDLLG